MDRSMQDKRRKRINRLKKMIIGTIILAIVLPMASCSVLLYQVFSLKEELREVSAARDSLMQTIADGSFHLGEDDYLFPEEASDIPVEELGAESVQDDTRKVYLTFDDGPSDNTEKILEVLKLYDVKATFFVTGEAALSHPERYKAIVDAGHSIGMHSYSHRYSEIYASVDNFGSDLTKLQEFITQTTGVTPTIYRFPGGSSNTVSRIPMSTFCDYLADNEINYYDWNVSSKDASNPMRSKDEIVRNCTKDLESFKNAMILMHDSNSKTSTVEALPEIIEAIQKMENTVLLPITDDAVVIHHK